MPLSLVYPFVIATGAGYLIVRGSPLGVFGALFGMITAILPVFVGDGPPGDVDTAYGMVCGVLLGLAAGRVAQLALWPRTAMQTFAERAAAQFDVCLRALRGSEGAARDVAGLVSGYAKQLTLLGKLHEQAHTEPIERALDDGRRAELLVLIQGLFDCSLQARRTTAAEIEQLTAGDSLAPLREALGHQDEVLKASMAAAARVLRGAASEIDSGLASATEAVELQLRSLDRRETARGLDVRRLDLLMAVVEGRRQLMAGQLAIEAWLADWQQAVSAETAV